MSRLLLRKVTVSIRRSSQYPLNSTNEPLGLALFVRVIIIVSFYDDLTSIVLHTQIPQLLKVLFITTLVWRWFDVSLMVEYVINWFPSVERRSEQSVDSLVPTIVDNRTPYHSL